MLDCDAGGRVRASLADRQGLEMDERLMFYAAVAAYGTWATVICALVIVWLQNRAAKRLTCLQLFVQLSSQYESADMKASRARLAGALIDNPATLEIDDSILSFFETVATLERKSLLEKDLIWSAFSVDVCCYWQALRHYVLEARENLGDKTLFEEFERLAGRFDSRSTRMAPHYRGSDALSRFLEFEKRRYSGD